MNKIMSVWIMGIFILSGIGIIPSSGHINPSETYDLLIISPDLFVNELKPLINHKNEHGVETVMKTLEEIYDEYEGRDEAEQIKYFIKDAMENWHIQYVLLVGGRKPSILGEKWLLPAIYSHIEDNLAIPEDRYLSDLYYADIYDDEGNFSSWDSNDNGVYGEWYANEHAYDIIDLYPDVYVGRLPCRNKAEVKIMVNKIIKYEKESCPESWFKRMVVVGGDTYTDNDYFEGEMANQQALDNMSGYEPVKLWASDGSFDSWKDVVREINEGCGFLYFAGHGSPSAWATHPPYDNSTWISGLKITHMYLLFNRGKLPICVVGGCHNSMFNISLFHGSWTYGYPVFECWSWRLTRKVGGGTIATIGSTGLGYGKEDKHNPELGGAGDHLDILFFRECGVNSVEILGEAWGEAITSYLDDFPIDWSQQAFNDTALDAKTVQEWVLFGDPSLKIGGYG